MKKPPPVPGLSPEEQARMKDMWGRGYSVSEIAEALGRHIRTIRNWRERLNLEQRRAGLSASVAERLRGRDAELWRLVCVEKLRIADVARAYDLKVESVEAAIEREARRQNKTTRERSCLRCRKAFESHGPGHRLCDTCRDSASRAAPYVWGTSW